MADAPTYDWGTVTGEAVEQLAAKKIVPVPAPIVALAQKSYDGVKHTNREGEEVLTHNLHHEFATEEMAAEFARHMRKAGDHTTPKSSVTVVVDPFEHAKLPDGKRHPQAGNKKLVGWKAGKRRGRQ